MKRAELQRKLAMTPVPKPPAGLAERIKSEIPNELRFNAEDERERLASSIALNLRVAASILVLVATAFLALRVISRAPLSESKQAASAPAALRVIAQTDTVAAIPTASVVDTTSALRDEQPKIVSRRSKQKKEAPPVAKLEKKDERAADEVKVSEYVAASAPVPPPPAAPTENRAAAAESIQAAPAPVVVQAERVAKTAATRLEARGPQDSWMQHFAAPESLPEAAVLDVEAVEDPVARTNIVLRVSFDSGVAVRDLWMNIDLNSDVANSARRLAGSTRWGSSDFNKASRSVLIELPMPASDASPIATIHVRYRVGDDRIEQTVEKIVRRTDVRAWIASSRRMKSATIAALWQNGADRDSLIDGARAAGLNELADTIARDRR